MLELSPQENPDETVSADDSLQEDELSALASEFFLPERQTVVSLGPKA